MKLETLLSDITQLIRSGNLETAYYQINTIANDYPLTLLLKARILRLLGATVESRRKYLDQIDITVIEDDPELKIMILMEKIYTSGEKKEAMLGLLDNMIEQIDVQSELLAEYYLLKNSLGLYEEVPDKRKQYLTRALKIFEDTANHHFLAGTHLALAWFWMHKNNETAALDHLNHAQSIGSLNNDLTILSNFNNSYAIHHLYFGDPNVALKHLDRSLELFNQVKEGKVLLQHQLPRGTSHNKAVVFRSLGRNEEAIGIFETILDQAKKQNDTRAHPITLRNLGYCYSNIGEFNKAIKYTNQSVEEASITNNVQQLIYSYNALGMMFATKGEPQTGVGFAEKSLDLIENRSTETRLFTYYSIGRAYYQKMDYDTAERYIKEVMQISEAEEIKRPVELRYLIPAQMIYARLLLQRKEKQRGLKLLNDAHRSANSAYKKMKGTFHQIIIKILQQLILYHLEDDNIDNALTYFEKLKHLEDTFTSIFLSTHIKFSDALILKTRGRGGDLFNSKEIFYDIINHKIVDFSLTIASILHVIEILSKELKFTTRPEEVISEIRELIDLLRDHADRNSIKSLQIIYKIISANLSLISKDQEISYELYKDAQLISEENELEELLQVSIRDKDVENFIIRWSDLVEGSYSINDKIEKLKFRQYINKASKYIQENG